MEKWVVDSLCSSRAAGEVQVDRVVRDLIVSISSDELIPDDDGAGSSS